MTWHDVDYLKVTMPFQIFEFQTEPGLNFNSTHFYTKFVFLFLRWSFTGDTDHEATVRENSPDVHTDVHVTVERNGSTATKEARTR